MLRVVVSLGLRNGRMDEKTKQLPFVEEVDDEGENKAEHSGRAADARVLDGKLASALLMRSPFLESRPGPRDAGWPRKASRQ